jgi:hypothetical protein
VRDSDRRTTLQITVDRGGELIVSAPTGCDLAIVEGFVREKRLWIYTKLAEKEALRHPTNTKQYVSGEGFPYLGRSYRLLVVDEQSVAVKLEDGRFKIRRSALQDGRGHMVTWYTAHAQRWLEDKVERFASRVGIAPERIVVRDLGYRWGSCGKGRTINFHWKSVLPPPRIVEYIVVHELVHLAEPLHAPNFWLNVERAMPDFAVRKQWLAENGHHVGAV